MQRILVIGSGGAGQSTFARRLGENTGIEVIHLDRLYWQAGLVEPSKIEWNKTVRKLVLKDFWIMDGNFGSSLEIRLRQCDAVFFLQIPRTVCIWRVLRRTLIYKGKTRPDMGDGCPEDLISIFCCGFGVFRKKINLRLKGCWKE